MKSAALILLGVFLFVGCAYSASAATVNQVVRGEGPSCPIDEPLAINPGTFNISIPPLLVIDIGSTQGGGVATGLSSLWTNTSFVFIETALYFDVTVKYADVTGINYEATGSVAGGPLNPDILPTGPYTGSGNYKAAVADFQTKGKAVFLVNLITNRITVRELYVDIFTFGELHVDLGNLVVGGVPVDFVKWNKDIVSNFEADWATKKEAILEHFRVSANEKLKEYTIQDILDLIEGKPCPTEAPSSGHN
jgi:hypothetical protein